MAQVKVVAALLLGLTVACGAGARSGERASPSPTAEVTIADLKYALIANVGPVWYCSPDQYPVARPVSDGDVQARLAAARARDPASYEAILRHRHLREEALTVADRRAVYQDVQDLEALRLEADGADYRFDYTVRPTGAGTPGTRVTGTIDRVGSVVVGSRTPHTVVCPICLAAGTTIATPAGELPVERLRPGMIVWSRDVAGNRVAVPVVAVGTTPVPSSHRVVHLALADGRRVDVSPGHPTADGRPVADLRPGDRYDGSPIVAASLEPYRGGATFDLLPAGPTGVYWAGGIPLRSSLIASAG